MSSSCWLASFLLIVMLALQHSRAEAVSETNHLIIDLYEPLAPSNKQGVAAQTYHKGTVHACLAPVNICPLTTGATLSRSLDSSWSDVACCGSKGDDRDSILPKAVSPVGRCIVGTNYARQLNVAQGVSATTRAAAGGDAGGVSAVAGLFDAYCQLSHGADACAVDDPLCEGMILTASGSGLTVIVASRSMPVVPPLADNCNVDPTQCTEDSTLPWCDGLRTVASVNVTGADLPSNLQRTMDMIISSSAGNRMQQDEEEMVFVGPASLLSGPMSVTSRYGKMRFEHGWFEQLVPEFVCAGQRVCEIKKVIVNGHVQIIKICKCRPVVGQVVFQTWPRVPASMVRSFGIPILDEVDSSFKLKFFEEKGKDSY